MGGRTWAGILLTIAIALPARGEPSRPRYSLDRLELAGGAELLTIVYHAPADPDAAPVPLLSVLRDTLGDGDPENDRLRYLWLLNNGRPAWWQRIAAATPFFYRRAAGDRDDTLPPRPLIDIASQHPMVLSDLGKLSLQVWTFDPAGLALRASSRAYQGNLSNEQKSRFEQALAVVAAFEQQPEAAEAFTKSELERLRARLLLGQRKLGGLVSESRFAKVSANEWRATEETRGRNWEILRQAAESGGLWFEPVSLGQKEPNYALIWLREGDAEPRPAHFDAKFLRIRDPWTDGRLSGWQGYARQLPGGERMIPLALYDLEHPRAPLLLVDFRDSSKPRRREIFQRSLTDLMRSVFGLSYISDWYFYATRGAHDFVSGRRGAATDPLARLRAYAKLKLQLGVDRSLDAPLREELQAQLARLALNPLETNFNGDARIARGHHELLAERALDPEGLPRKLERDRSAELRPALHSAGTRMLLRAAAVASLGIYRHREEIDASAMALLDLRRRLDHHEKFLRQAAESPQVEVDWDIERVKRSLEFVAATRYGASRRRPALLAKLFTRTQDEGLRETCFHQLKLEDSRASRRELARLSRSAAIPEEWRERLLIASETAAPGKPTLTGAAGAGFAIAGQ